MDTNYQQKAQELLQMLEKSSNSTIQHSVHPPVAYEMAVASIIFQQEHPGETLRARFPEVFKSLLDLQQANGAWEIPGYELGTMLSTSAGLLAIVRLIQHLPQERRSMAKSLSLRASKAEQYLRERLKALDPTADRLRGASIALLAAVLRSLKSEKIVFDLKYNLGSKEPCEAASCDVCQSQCCTLEAYAGILESGELVRASSDEALMEEPPDHSRSHPTGGPSKLTTITRRNGQTELVFTPSSFETIIAMEILIDSGLSDASEHLHSLDSCNAERNLTYHTPTRPSSRLFDHSLDLLSVKLSVSSDSAQSVAEIERVISSATDLDVLSFDKRCRILKTVVRKPCKWTPESFMLGLLRLICDSWWKGDIQLDIVSDMQCSNRSTADCDLNQSPLYTIMLFLESVGQIYQLNHPGYSYLIQEGELHNRVQIVVVQMLAQMLSQQNSDGSWGPYRCSETSAYAMLALIAARRMGVCGPFDLEIEHALTIGREAMISIEVSRPKAHPLWFSKTAYGSDLLNGAFTLGALARTVEIPRATADSATAGSKALMLARFFHGLPNLRSEPFVKIKLAAVESGLYVSSLAPMLRDIFPRTLAKEKDKYLDYIPIMWTIHSIVRDAFVPPQLIWDIAILSMFIFLVDEYMEGTIVRFTADEFHDLIDGIKQLFELKEIKVDISSQDRVPKAAWSREELLLIHEPKLQAHSSSHVNEALDVLGTWARYHMTYPSVIDSSRADLLDLRQETKNYLLYHVHQLQDNQCLASQASTQPPICFARARMGYVPWLHTVGGGHIGALIGLVYFACITGSRVRGAGKDCFSNVKQKLMAWNANTRASKQLRMFNDYGSVVRDAHEANLNSINFPEFFGRSDEEREQAVREESDGFQVIILKQELLDAAQYERQRTNTELKELYAELKTEGAEGRTIADWLGVYYAGGDQFSDMYLMRDVTNSTRS